MTKDNNEPYYRWCYLMCTKFDSVGAAEESHETTSGLKMELLLHSLKSCY